jgi:hypothetical protein
VLLLTCGDTYARGLYPLTALSVQPLDKARPARDYPAPQRAVPNEAAAGLEALAGVADQLLALVASASCFRGPVPAGFSLAFRRGNDIVFLRDAAP